MSPQRYASNQSLISISWPENDAVASSAFDTRFVLVFQKVPGFAKLILLIGLVISKIFFTFTSCANGVYASEVTRLSVGGVLREIVRVWHANHSNCVDTDFCDSYHCNCESQIL